jgi:hypothetical protein
MLTIKAPAAGGYAELTNEAGLVTDAGVDFLGRIGVDLDVLLTPRTKRSGRVLCRPCLDWSERRWHLAGAIGARVGSSAPVATMGALGRVDAGQRTCELTAAQVLVGADIVEKLGS